MIEVTMVPLIVMAGKRSASYKVHIGYEADVTAHLLDTDGKKVTELLDKGAVVSVMPTIKTWTRMGFTRKDLIPNLRLAAANRGASYIAGRTPITIFLSHGRTESMDEFPCSGEAGRFGSVHFGSRLRQEF